MKQSARWFLVLGILVLLPAAVMLGASAGAVLRDPQEGFGALLRNEAWIIGLAVAATFLLSTAAGLHAERSWALLLALAQAAMLVLAAAASLAGGATFMRGLGGAPELVLGIVPVCLGVGLVGARLFATLWRAAKFPLPFGPADLRAIGALAAVTATALVGHALVAGLTL
ncbi:MAG TPA: hypothetical protein VHK63_03045 [Candidatus Limnocylindria bacterium]|nr:hypothetical protein [Candidatus Limnocylindria bacterium]